MTLRDWHVRNGMQTYMHLLQALVHITNFVLYSSEIENDPIVPFHTSNLTMLSGERLCIVQPLYQAAHQCQENYFKARSKGFPHQE